MAVDPLLRNVRGELTTDRLVLRTPRAGDGVIVHAAMVETLADLRAWPASLPWAQSEPSVDASETFCRESAAAFIKRSELVYLVFDREGAFVATVSLHTIDWSVPKFELGFWCRTSRQRQGLMVEAARELTRYAFDELGAQRVHAVPDAENLGSRGVCESVGMQLEGVLRNERVAPDGTMRHSCVYARVATGG